MRLTSRIRWLCKRVATTKEGQIKHLLNESLSSNEQAGLCEHEALRLLSIERPSNRAVAEAQALATIGQSLRLRGVEEWLGSIRDDGVGVG